MPAEPTTHQLTTRSDDLAVELLGNSVAVVEIRRSPARSIRQTLRSGLAADAAGATDHERSEQAWLRGTADFVDVTATPRRIDCALCHS